MALGSLLGPEGRPMSLESGFRTGQRGVGTTSRWAEAKKSFRELLCFWESGTVGASGLTGRPLPPCLPWRESTLREFPGLAQLAVSSFLLRPSQGALEESMPHLLPSRLWLGSPLASLSLTPTWFSGDPPAVPPEAGGADQAAEQLYQLHHSAEAAAAGAGPCPEEVRACPHVPHARPYLIVPAPIPCGLGLRVHVSPGGVGRWH